MRPESKAFSVCAKRGCTSGGKGYRCNFNSFMGVIIDGKELLLMWRFLNFRAEFLALECDHLGNEALSTHISLKDRSDPTNPNAGSTSALQVDEKAIRQCSQNSVAITVLTLGNPNNNRRLCGCIRNAALRVTARHQHQTVEVRDTSRARAWLIEQMHGGFMLHVWEVLLCYATDSATFDIGFLCSNQQAKHMSDEQIMMENELASHLGQLCAHTKVLLARRGGPWL